MAKTIWRVEVNTLKSDPVVNYLEIRKTPEDSAQQAIKFASSLGRYLGKYCENGLNYITVHFCTPEMDHAIYSASYHPADGWYRA